MTSLNFLSHLPEAGVSCDVVVSDIVDLGLAVALVVASVVDDSTDS